MIHQRGGAKSNDQKGPNQVDKNKLLERPVSDHLAIIGDSVCSKVTWAERGCHYLRLNDQSIASNISRRPSLCE